MLIRYIIIIILIAAVIYCSFRSTATYRIKVNKKTYTFLEFLLTDFKHRKVNYNKSENKCRSIIENIYKQPFPSIRPDFLRNPVTGKNLELDMYNENMKLAFEYNGVQHYKYTPFFHRNYNDFLKQKLYDKYKKSVCKRLGITLITIPYTVKYKDLNKWITLRCLKLKQYI